MEDKIILDLCGGTGAWSRPYKEVGYTVYNITLPEYDLNKFTINKLVDIDYIIFYSLTGRTDLYIEIKDIYGILAAPPCTMFSIARTTAKTPRDFKKGMELVIACLNIIWECQYKNRLKFWALENPVGFLRQLLGKPVFTFNPCDFGDRYTKKTDLWGYFNIPKKKPIKLNSSEQGDCTKNIKKLPPIPDDYFIPNGIRKDSVRRAITPAGFAKAFFRANK